MSSRSPLTALFPIQYIQLKDCLVDELATLAIVPPPAVLRGTSDISATPDLALAPASVAVAVKMETDWVIQHVG
jgi:hypothetical protein